MSEPPDTVRAAFRPVGEAELALLAGWLAQPHVFRWWHESPDPESVRAKYVPPKHGPVTVHRLIASWDGVDCGMFQHYRWDTDPDLAPTVGALPGEAGIDYLIGVPELVDRGLGPRMIGVFIDTLVLTDPEVTGIRVDVNAENLRSRKTLEKLGFGRVEGREFVDDGERCVVYQRPR